MLARVKKSQITARLNNNQGQALIEYVLMLIITVSIVIALMNQIFKPFGDFVDNYMGKYVSCLLEYGELPSFGSEVPSAVEDDSECNKRFQKGSLANGRPPAAGRGGSGSDGEKGDSSKEGASAGTSDDSSGGGSGTYAGSSSRGGSRFVNSGRRPSSGVESGDAQAGGKVVEIALEGGGSGGFFKSRGGGGSYYQGGRKTASVPITGLTEAEKKKLQKKAEGTAKIIKVDETIAQDPKKTVVKPPELKTELPPEEPLTIGNFIRYLFIAALIIALVIFIGGQALQMSKSMDK